jgi:hypothetical protein
MFFHFRCTVALPAHSLRNGRAGFGFPVYTISKNALAIGTSDFFHQLTEWFSERFRLFFQVSECFFSLAQIPIAAHCLQRLRRCDG